LRTEEFIDFEPCHLYVMNVRSSFRDAGIHDVAHILNGVTLLVDGDPVASGGYTLIEGIPELWAITCNDTPPLRFCRLAKELVNQLVALHPRVTAHTEEYPGFLEFLGFERSFWDADVGSYLYIRERRL